MKILRRLLAYAKPIHHYLPEYFIYTLLGIVLGIVNFGMLIPLLNLLFNADGISAVKPPPHYEFSLSYFHHLFNYHVGNIAVVSGKMNALLLVCAVIGVSTIFSNMFRYMAARVQTRLKLTVLERLRNDLYAKITHQSLSWYNQNKRGDILSTMTNDVQEIESSVISSFQVLLRDPFAILAYFISLFLLSAKLTIFTILFFPLAGFLISTLAKRLKSKGYFSQEMLGRIMQHTNETLGGIRVIQAFRAQNRFKATFQQINASFTANSKSLFYQRELASPLSDILGIFVVVVLVIYGGSLVIGGELSGSMFVTYLALYSQVLQPAKNISSATTSMQKGVVSAERIFNLLDTKTAIEDQARAINVTQFDRAIEFQNVGFCYDTDFVLRHIHLVITKGTSLALVGKSGSGKSTFADLLLRFYNTSEGQISIDGHPLECLTLSSLRSLIGIVNQDPVIFNDTVINNITMGQVEPDFSKVEEAARNAHALEFISQMEEGFFTTLGDRGSRLSGGQRQRIAIARALYANPPILILDEATSALDTESEKLVQDAISHLMKGRTSIVIAHRLSTIQQADTIVVLDKGAVVETGDHNSLMAANGLYKRLVDLQTL